MLVGGANFTLSPPNEEQTSKFMWIVCSSFVPQEQTGLPIRTPTGHFLFRFLAGGGGQLHPQPPQMRNKRRKYARSFVLRLFLRNKRTIGPVGLMTIFGGPLLVFTPGKGEVPPPPNRPKIFGTQPNM